MNKPLHELTNNILYWDMETETIYVKQEYRADIINGLAHEIHVDNCKKGFWDNPRELGTMLMLAVSELAEALEGDRKDLMDDHLPSRKMLEVELADAIIRIMDTARGHHLDLGGAIMEKLEYNRKRPYKHGVKY